MKDVLIITGGSRGIGKAVAEAFADRGFSVYSISRSAASYQNREAVQHIQFDLSRSEGLEETVTSIFQQLSPQATRSLVLINNAASLGEIGPLETCSPSSIESTIHLNLTTPFLLTALFIRHTREWNCPKQVINISSGAAAKPYYGWSLYCSTKAGIDMLTRAVALEQNELSNGVKIISLSPGVVDTEMQTTIRSTDPAQFKDKERFLRLKNENALATPEEAAEGIYKVCMDDTISNGALVDLRTY